MTFNLENVLLIGSVLLLLSVLASKTSGKFGVPALVIFLTVGMLAGSDGIGKIHFDDPGIAQMLGVVALIFILFSGGLETKWESIKPVLWQGITLSTMGVLITTLSLGIFITAITNFTFVEALLMGAIVSSTDAAAVFSILRSKNTGLKGNLRPLLELESGSNDPMAYILTIGITAFLVNPETSYISLVGMFFQQMILGALAGVVFGKMMIWVLNKINLDYEGLYPVLILALILLIYSFTTFINGNGFLAVYLAAIILGNKNFIHKKSIMRFYDGQAWLMQIIMFLTLGLLVYPKQIVPFAGIGIIIAMFLIFVARPIAVFLSLLPFKINTRQKLFISWVGLRGAVPIVFATYPLIQGVEKSGLIFNIVFFIVITSVILQGTTIQLVAKWLYQFKPLKFKKRYPLELELSDHFKNELFEIKINDDSNAIGRQIFELNFPKSALIVLVSRNDAYITPNGTTTILTGDKLLVMSDNKNDETAINFIVNGSPDELLVKS